VAGSLLSMGQQQWTATRPWVLVFTGQQQAGKRPTMALGPTITMSCQWANT
jgi:hypothetical protein